MRKDWIEAHLGELITLEYGKPLKEEQRDGLGYPVFASAGQVGLHSKPLLDESPVIIVGRKGTAGSVWWSDSPCSVIDTAFYVKLNSDCEKRFLYLLLAYVNLPSLAAQTGVPGLNRDRAYSCKVLIPPLVDQQRIVDLVSSVDAYIAALEQQADTARTARSAVLHELLTAGGDDWTETTLGKTLEIARGGSPRPIRDYITSEEDGVNWVKIGDASASSKYIYQTEQKIRREGISRSRPVEVGDFILSNSMSFGRPYIMGTAGCIHDGWLLFSKVEKHFDEDFLYNLLMSDSVQKQFDSLAAGSGVRNLNIEVVKEVVISLPPLEVQREIAAVANAMDEFILTVEQAVEDAKKLRSALLSDLLSGEHEIPESYDRVLKAA